MGIPGGLFTCEGPQDWKMETEDVSRHQASELKFLGPRAESAPVMIFVFYFGEGSPYFDGMQDYLQRNTWDSWEDKAVAEAKPVDLHGIQAVTFEKETESFLDPESPASAKVLLKEKFYVFPSKEGKGFFAIHYTAPKTVYETYRPALEKIADSFTML